jgi:acetyl-CoA acyltransferase
MDDVYIVGLGMTPFGKYSDLSVRNLTESAVTAALDDAGGEVDDIGAAFFGNTSQGALEGQFMVRGEMALRDLKFKNIPVINVENACATASTAFHQAVTHIRAGESDVALAVGAEKMYFEDKERVFGIFDGAWDVHDRAGTYDLLKGIAAGCDVPEEALASQANQKSLFMDVYAFLTRYHMEKFGTTQRQLAAVASKNHFHSSLNPLSQFRHDMSVDEVMAARLISWPLTLPMCAPISDGAAAAVVCSKEALGRFSASRAVKVHACELGTGSERAPDQFDQHVCRLTSQRAYNKAGVGPGDMSVAELHDASAFAEIQHTENLGFCDFGEGGPLVESGATRLGGRIPVNPSGGLESKGHPIGATGLAQICELGFQVRGECGDRQVDDVDFAIAENGGGFHGVEEAAVCITILGK